MEHERLFALEADLEVAFEKLDLGGLRLCAVVVVEAEFAAGDTFGVGEVFEEAGLVSRGFRFHVFRVDSVGGINVAVFFGELAAAGEVGGIACHMDKGFGKREAAFGGGGGAEAREEGLEGFSGVPLVGVDVAMGIDKHGVHSSTRHPRFRR